MNQIIDIAFSPVNAFLSIICIALLLYWILTILTGIDLDFFDVDFDASTDFDVDMDADLDNYNPDVDLPQQNVNSETSSDGVVISFFRYFSFDELPLMFMLSILFFSAWFISVNATHYLNWSGDWKGFVLLIPIFFVSLFVTKVLTKPVARLYRMINHKGEEEIDFLGRQCVVKSSVKEDRFGQIEVVIGNDPILLVAKGFKGVSISSGEKAVIVNESKDKKYYLIAKFEI